MKHRQHMIKRSLGLSLLFLVVILTSACGNKLIRGASPMVRLTELRHQDNKISVQLSMRNLNGVDMDVLSIDVSLSVNEDTLFVYQGPVDTNIAANGTETWSVEVEESQTGRKLLDQLQEGDVKSLPYSLKGAITSQNDGNLRFEYEGHIYPLPGRPGHFR